MNVFAFHFNIFRKSAEITSNVRRWR